MAESAGILFKIKGDSSDAVKATKEVDAAMKNIYDRSRDLGEGIADSAKNIGKAFAIMGGAASAFGVTLLKIVKDTSDYGSAIFDASQKTGLTTESLSALKYQADLSGSSFEQVTKGVTNFGVEVGKANSGNDEAVKKMALLRVTSNDLDTALKQAFATINSGKTDTDKLALASEAFGKKIGPDLIPLIKDSNGNLTEMIRKARDLGLVLSKEAAEAADEFGDNLATLELQLQGVRNTIGNALMPQFNAMATRISSWLVQNKAEVESWANKFAQSIKDIGDTFEGFAQDQKKPGSFSNFMQTIDDFVRDHPYIFPAGALQGLGAAYRTDAQAGQAIGSGALRPDNTIDFSKLGRATANTPKPTDTGDAGFTGENAAAEAAKKKKAQEDKDIAAAIRTEAINLRQVQESLAAAYEKMRTTLTEGGVVEGFAAKTNDVTKQWAGNIQSSLKYLEELENKALGVDASQAERDELAQEQQTRRHKLKLEQDEEIKKNKDALEKTRTENAEKEAAGIELLAGLEQQRFDAQWEHQTALAKNLAETMAQFEATMVKPSDSPGEGNKENSGPFAEWGRSWQSFVDILNASAPGIKETLAGVGSLALEFGQNMAQAVGGAIEQWALYGGSVTKALRQALAAELAHIAGVATINALYATALGFLRLAELNFPAAGAAFTSAAIWAAVAGGAAIAARAIAPKQAEKSFSSQAQQATSSSRNVQGQGSQYSGQPDAVYGGSRNAPAVKVQLEVKLRSGGVIDIVENSIKTNGRMRDLIVDAN